MPGQVDDWTDRNEYMRAKILSEICTIKTGFSNTQGLTLLLN